LTQPSGSLKNKGRLNSRPLSYIGLARQSNDHRSLCILIEVTSHVTLRPRAKSQAFKATLARISTNHRTVAALAPTDPALGSTGATTATVVATIASTDPALGSTGATLASNEAPTFPSGAILATNDPLIFPSVATPAPTDPAPGSTGATTATVVATLLPINPTLRSTDRAPGSVAATPGSTASIARSIAPPNAHRGDPRLCQ
jgi:hypothetical protein